MTGSGDAVGFVVVGDEPAKPADRIIGAAMGGNYTDGRPVSFCLMQWKHSLQRTPNGGAKLGASRKRRMSG
jgi:hypothetical protein